MRSVVDITLGVPVSGPRGPQILGYLVLPRLLVADRGIRLFGTSEPGRLLTSLYGPGPREERHRRVKSTVKASASPAPWS